MNLRNQAIDHYFDAFQPRNELPASSLLVFKAMLTLNLWMQTSKSRRALSDLEDNHLKDIGITKYDADCEARRAFYDI